MTLKDELEHACCVSPLCSKVCFATLTSSGFSLKFRNQKIIKKIFLQKIILQILTQSDIMRWDVDCAQYVCAYYTQP